MNHIVLIFRAIQRNIFFYSMLTLGSIIFASESSTPKTLYKVTSPELWQQSKNCTHLLLDKMDTDDAFIHLSTKEQLNDIINKFWKNKKYIILQIKASEMEGILKFEANKPGGNKYYHLYNGALPMKSLKKSASPIKPTTT